MKFSEKKTQTLLALFDKKFDGKYYEISELLGKHGIVTSYQEAYQIGQALEDEGFVNLAASKDSVSAFITGEGVEFVEEYDFFNDDENPYSGFTDEEIIIINQKLDELLGRIAKIELGQQITYDDISEEIEDLKSLSKKLNKKNWFEVLQGKLVVIGLGKLTDKAIELISSTFGSQNLIK